MVGLMTNHAKLQLMTGTWRLLGWFKAASTTEGAVYNPRVHIVNLKKNSPVVRFVAPEPDQEEENPPAHEERVAPPANDTPATTPPVSDNSATTPTATSAHL